MRAQLQEYVAVFLLPSRELKCRKADKGVSSCKTIMRDSFSRKGRRWHEVPDEGAPEYRSSFSP